MFSVGQMVYHIAGKHAGTVLECDGDTVYLVQDNGVEIEFRRAELTATPPDSGARTGPVVTAVTTHAPIKPIASASARVVAPVAVPSRVLSTQDITDEHRKVLAIIPQRTMQAVAALFERQPKAGKFSALDVARKLNFIAEVTAVPYRTMKQYSDSPGTLGLMMARELSIRSGSAR